MKKISEKILTLMSEVVFGNKKYLSWLKSQETKQKQAKEWKVYVVNKDLEISSSDQFQGNNFLCENKEEMQEKEHGPPLEEETKDWDELEKLIGIL